MLVTPMKLARQASALLLWAATCSRGLFAQQLPSSPDKFQLRGVELRYVLPEPLFDNEQTTEPIKALYVHAWAFGSSKLAQLVRLADSTEINAFVVDIKDDTGGLRRPQARRNATRGRPGGDRDTHASHPAARRAGHVRHLRPDGVRHE